MNRAEVAQFTLSAADTLEQFLDWNPDIGMIIIEGAAGFLGEGFPPSIALVDSQLLSHRSENERVNESLP
jgi:hypothetical protein